MSFNILNNKSIKSNKIYILIALVLSFIAINLLFMPQTTMAAFSGPNYKKIPSDVLGAPYRGAPYYSNYPDNTSYPGYLGYCTHSGGCRPSISLFEDNNYYLSGDKTQMGGAIFSWVSPQGQSQYDGNIQTNQQITESPGSSSLQLQLTDMNFICRYGTQNNTEGPANDNTIIDTQPLVGSGTGSQKPLTGAYNAYLLHFKVKGITAVSKNGYNYPSGPNIGQAGTFSSGFVGQQYYICNQTKTRYWYVSSGSCGTSGNGDFTFTPYKNVTQTITMTITQSGYARFYSGSDK